MPHYRTITVDGQDYEWVVGGDIVKVKGVGITNKDRLATVSGWDDIGGPYGVCPAEVADFIRQKLAGTWVDLPPSDEPENTPLRRYEAEFMDADEFVALATEILEAASQLGRLTKRGPWLGYHDDIMSIMSDHNGLALEIERMPLTVESNGAMFVPGTIESSLRGSNPTTMVTKKGEIIRHHGEHCYLVQHMKAVRDRLLMLRNFRNRLDDRGEDNQMNDGLDKE